MEWVVRQENLKQWHGLISQRHGCCSVNEIFSENSKQKDTGNVQLIEERGAGIGGG